MNPTGDTPTVGKERHTRRGTTTDRPVFPDCVTGTLLYYTSPVVDSVCRASLGSDVGLRTFRAREGRPEERT